MRKTNLFGATVLALSASAWSLTALAQPAAAPAPAAPTAAPAPEAAPAPAAPDAAAPTATTPDSATPPAKSASKKHTMHHMSHSKGKGKLVATKAGDRAVDDLNSASLDSAKSGKPFSAPTTPDAAKKTAHAGDMGASAKHHHMMHKTMKKPASSDSAAAPADTNATPPADTTGK